MSKPIKIWLMGGLGNNLFQIAFGKYLETNGCVVSYVDNLLYPNYLTRLCGWQTWDRDILELYPELKIIHHNNVLPAIVAKLNICKSYASFFETTQSFDCRHLFGYFQDPTFCKYIKFNDPLSPNKIRTGIHLRLSDSNFLSENLLMINEFLDEDTSDDDYLIYSEDLETANEVLSVPDRQLIFSNNKTALEDFLSLMGHEKLVISNSTFSWWAAILSPVVKTLVISKNQFDILGLPANFERSHDCGNYYIFKKKY